MPYGSGSKLSRRLACVLVFCCAGCHGVSGKSTEHGLFSERHRGVSWVATPQRFEQDTFYTVLREHHVNWIVQTPFGWQQRHDTPKIGLATGDGVMWGEGDEGLVVTATWARKHDIKTLLKPHIWITRGGGKWRSDIEMSSEADWDAWFADYSKFILHYARLAEENDFPALCIGTELRKTLAQERRWHQLIRQIREVYRGQLTYAANWWKEFEEVPFWDELDFIGIQAYFPIADRSRPTVEAMKRNWEPHLKRIRSVQSRHGKPVVFTEIGYRNTPDNAVEPWVWPKRPEFEKISEDNYRPIPDPDVDIDLEAQAASFQAMFEVFWNQPWFQGAYVWKWHPARLNVPPDKVLFESFSPQGGPAMDVIRQWYAQP